MFDHFRVAFRSWRIWYTLAIQDILARYRGSTLGPFWITITTAITVFSMGYLYGTLFGINRTDYLPYFTTGIIAWNFISMVITESTKIILESKSYMENIQLPSILFIFRLLFRNLIILIHTLPVYVVVALMYKIPVNSSILFFVPALIAVSFIGILYSTVIAFVSTRFPDVGSIVTSILQIFFFTTPIMWMPSALPLKYQIFLTLNPFYYLVSLLRSPLLGIPFSSQDLLGTLVLILLGLFIFVPVMKKYNNRVIFWI